VCEASKELDNFMTVALAFGEEKTCSEAVLIVQIASEGASDGGFARARHTTQPENTPAMGIVVPCHELAAEVNAGMGETLRFSLLIVRVECGTISTR